MASFLVAPVIVVGMHASGTSLLTSLIAQRGVFVGRALDSHLESQFFQDVNDELLGCAGARWDRPEPLHYALGNKGQRSALRYVALRRLMSLDFFRRHFNWRLLGRSRVRRFPLWGWKDPRTTVTAAIWSEFFPHARWLFIHRHGLHVAQSLAEREAAWPKETPERFRSQRCLQPLQAFALWEEYHEMFFAFTRTLPDNQLLHISFDALVHSPERELRRVCRFLCLSPAESGTTTAQLDTERADRHDRRRWPQELGTAFMKSPIAEALGYLRQHEIQSEDEQR